MSLSRHNVFYISRKGCTIALLKPMTTFTAETTFKAQLISTIQQIIIQQCKAKQGYISALHKQKFSLGWEKNRDSENVKLFGGSMLR